MKEKEGLKHQENERAGGLHLEGSFNRQSEGFSKEGALGAGALVGAGALAGVSLFNKDNPSKTQSEEKNKVKKDQIKQKFSKQPEKFTPKSKKTSSLDKNQNNNKSKIKKPNSQSKNGIERQSKNNAKQRASSPAGRLAGNELKTSSDTNLKLAQANTRSKNCPISMPEIRSAIVFQSVEAPQIEPIDQQASFPYDNYDLVMGKPAGVLIELGGGQMDKRKEFAMDLNISGENKYRDRCFHEPMKKEMEEGGEDFCFFTRNDLRSEGFFKFFPLPMNESVLNREVKNLPITITLYPRDHSQNTNCFRQTSFKINIIKTTNLKLGFTRIDGGKKCYASTIRNTGYGVVSYNDVEDFVDSDEVSKNIPSMFPVAKVISDTLTYNWKGKYWDYVEGNCNNRLARKSSKRTIGILWDVAQLEYMRAFLGHHKLIAIASHSYFNFHLGIGHDSIGFIISPKWKEERQFLFFKTLDFVGGSWNVAFIHEIELEGGTIAHELAHTLGQGKEFYESHEQCRRFKGSYLKTCQKYQIPRALSTRIDKQGRKIWDFVKNRYSIMNGTIEIKGRKRSRTADIYDLWIDRDSYQKTFKILSGDPVISKREELFGKSIVLPRKQKEENSTKAVITGFYYEKERSFIVPDIKVQKTKLFTPSFNSNTKNTKMSFATFQLKEGKKILKKIKIPIFEMQIKTLYKNKNPKIEPFEFSPLIAAFKLPSDYKKRNLRIIVLDPLGKEIYSAPVPKKQKSKPERFSLNTIEKQKRRGYA